MKKLLVLALVLVLVSSVTVTVFFISLFPLGLSNGESKQGQEHGIMTPSPPLISLFLVCTSERIQRSREGGREREKVEKNKLFGAMMRIENISICLAC